MAVFPKGMKQLDVSDSEGSLRTLEEYIRYMAERMEFSMANTTRTVSDAGVSSVALYQLMQEMAGSLSALRSTVATLQGTVASLQGDVKNMDERLKALEQAEKEETE